MSIRNPIVVPGMPVFEAHIREKYVVAVLKINEEATIGLRFTSPEQMLAFFDEMLKSASIVWPENEWIKEFVND